MFKNLFLLPKSFLRYMVVRILLFFALFSALGLSTLFLAFFMYSEWHWAPGCVVAACLGPWLLAVVILAIVAMCCASDVKYKKKNWISFDGINKKGLFFQALTIIDLMRKR